jgi:hypothetical protein
MLWGKPLAEWFSSAKFGPHVNLFPIQNFGVNRGYFRNVKVPSSPYKRGREVPCKRIHNFWAKSSLWEILYLLFRELHFRLKHSCILYSCTPMFGDSLRFFGLPNTHFVESRISYLEDNPILFK